MNLASTAVYFKKKQLNYCTPLNTYILYIQKSNILHNNKNKIN